ncbi:hypothetical protein, partial [Bacillus licheniformis]|uniref:hypothetical protein n=1 Tax=Bacillus licheniformis TaxID=1402 RepID=UPI001C52DE90
RMDFRKPFFDAFLTGTVFLCTSIAVHSFFDFACPKILDMQNTSCEPDHLNHGVFVNKIKNRLSICRSMESLNLMP